MKKTVYLMSGIAGSGKSTWMTEFVTKNKIANYAILSSDKIREKFVKKEDHSTSKDDTFVILQEQYNELLISKDIETIFIDATNLSPKRRLAYKRKNVKIVVVLMFCSLETAFSRTSSRKEDEVNFINSKKALIQQLKALTIPIVGVDCDEYILTGESFYKGKPSNEDISETSMFISTFSSLENFLPTVKRELVENELNGLYDSHDTPYHIETINEHINLTILNSNRIELKNIALFHDLGKGLYKNLGLNGIANYRGHERFGAIMYLNFIMSYMKGTKDTPIKFNYTLALAINYHMRPFSTMTTKWLKTNNINYELLNLLYEFNSIDRNSSIHE